MLLTLKSYAGMAIAALVVLLLLFAGWQYDRARVAGLKLDAAALAVTQLQAGVAQLQRGQDASDTAIHDMQVTLTAGGVHAATVRQRVVTMGKTNDAIGKFLDTPVPAGGCMLDDTCPGAAGAPIGSASGVVLTR